VRRPQEQFHQLAAVMVMLNSFPNGTPDIIVKMLKISIQTRSQTQLVGIKLTAASMTAMVTPLSISLNHPSSPSPQLVDAFERQQSPNQHRFVN
jgi:hypothetical protein